MSDIKRNLQKFRSMKIEFSENEFAKVIEVVLAFIAGLLW